MIWMAIRSRIFGFFLFGSFSSEHRDFRFLFPGFSLDTLFYFVSWKMFRHDFFSFSFVLF